MAAQAGDWNGGGGGSVPAPSGLLTQLPDGRNEAAVLTAALRQLTSVARGLSRNLRLMNGSLERVLQDKEDIDELEGMLNRFLGRQEAANR